MKFFLGSFAVLLGASTVAAFIPKHIGLQEDNVGTLTTRADYNSSTFQQLIDHKNPRTGKFSQFFYYSDEFWKGPGSPVIFFTPGEIAAAGYYTYLTNQRVTGVIAKEIGAAIVVMEHRYWGESSPYADLTTTNLQYLTLENAIEDTQYFARNAYLPFDPTNSSNAESVPWVFVGGSYSGALAAWTEAKTRDNPAMWAYLASSAVVEAVWDYWQYFVPVQQGMPANCSKDVSLVVDYMDGVLTHGSKSEQYSLKKLFGLETLEYNADVMNVLENGPWQWQGNQFTTGYSPFYQFCDAVENVVANQTLTSAQASAKGVGLNKALTGYARWIKEDFLPGYCSETYGYTNDTADISCFNSRDRNNKIYTDTTVANPADRQWVWMLCNEPFGYWQDGAPKGVPSLVSRLIDAKYWYQQCPLYFPKAGSHTFGYAKGKTAADVNKYTGGWSAKDTKRLFWTNGEFDPWRTSTVSSEFRPGGPLKSTTQAPVAIVPKGIHCSDFRTANGAVNAGVQKVIDTEVAQISAWVKEWPGKSHHY